MSSSSEKAPEKEEIAEKLENLSISDGKKVENSTESNGESSSPSGNKKKLTKEEEIEKVEKQIDEYVAVFNDPSATFDEKMKKIIKIPQDIEHSVLNRERADRLFGCIPMEMYQRVFDQKLNEYAYARPIIIHILSFVVQCTSTAVHRKYKPVLPDMIESLNPRGNTIPLTSGMYGDVTLMTGIWCDEPGDGKNVYNGLRYMTSFCAGQKTNLDVAQFLICIRTLIHKIFQIAPLEQLSAECFDNRCWTVGILAVIRRLLQENVNKFTPDLRKIVWEVVSSMTRIAGIAWFNLDKRFAILAIQMNYVEIQMCLSDVDNIDCQQFGTHMRILELYTSAIIEQDMFGDQEQRNIIQVVGDSTKYILAFWVETYLQNITLPIQLSCSILHFAVFVFSNEEVAILDDKTRKNFGATMLQTAFRALEESTETDLRGELGTLYSDIFERISEFEFLNDTVPLFIIKYLDKIRCADDYEGWKQRVIDCRCSIMDLRGRVDWYSMKTIKEARDLLPKFTEPEQHELSHLFKIFDVLPRVN